MLEAIEREDFNSLPGLLFARNFVKQYAVVLGLDPEPILAQLPHVDISAAPLPAPPARSTRAEIWDPDWNGAISSFAWFAIAVAAVVAAYIHFNRPLERVPGASGRQPVAAAAHPASGSSAAERTDAVNPQRAQTVPVSTKARRSVELNNASARNQPATKSPEADENPTGVPKVKVSITAHADAWIQVSADGRPVFTGTLKPNESRQISGDDEVKLVAGNAGGITVSLNGRTLDPLGAAGQVKVLRLTEEGLQAAVANRRPMDDRL
jgi:cytoskeletal protein RodZ